MFTRSRSQDDTYPHTATRITHTHPYRDHTHTPPLLQSPGVTHPSQLLLPAPACLASSDTFLTPTLGPHSSTLRGSCSGDPHLACTSYILSTHTVSPVLTPPPAMLNPQATLRVREAAASQGGRSPCPAAAGHQGGEPLRRLGPEPRASSILDSHSLPSLGQTDRQTHGHIYVRSHAQPRALRQPHGSSLFLIMGHSAPVYSPSWRWLESDK